MKGKFEKGLIINISIAGGVFVGVAVIIFILGFYINNESEYISSTRSDLDRASSISAKLSEFRRNEDDIEAAVEQLDSHVPDRDVVLFVPTEVRDIARRHGLGYVFNFSGEDREVTDEIMSTNFDINVQGDYDDIMRFIDDLENTQYFINILNIDLMSRSSGSYDGVIRGIIYFHA